MRHNLLLTGLACTLAFLAGPFTPAQAPRPVDAPRSEGIQPASLNKDSSPRPAAAPKDNQIKPAFGADEKVKPATSSEPSLHRMEIVSGPTRNVHYYAIGGSPTEQATLNRLSQAENELTYQESLLALKQQYINTESQMEARRREVQRKLYGLNLDDKVTNDATYSGLGLGQPSPYGPGSGWTDMQAGATLPGAFGAINSSGPFSSFPATGVPGAIGTPATLGSFVVPHGVGGTGGLAAGLAASGLLSSGTVPLGFSGGFGGFGGGFPFPFMMGQQGSPWSPYNINKVNLKQESNTNQSLANGIGDEGKFKTAMVLEMAKQATPESTSAAIGRHEAALRDYVAARLNREPSRSGIAAASLENLTPPKVEVTTTGKEKITGYLLKEDADWITLRTADSEERIRMADVARIKRELPKIDMNKEPKEEKKESK